MDQMEQEKLHLLEVQKIIKKMKKIADALECKIADIFK